MSSRQVTRWVRPEELKSALFVVWVIISGVMLLVLVAPFCVPADSLAVLLPECASMRLHGKPCLLCGMTTAFIHIARAEFAEARAANRLGLPLYALFVANELALALFLCSRKRVGRAGGEAPFNQRACTSRGDRS